MARPTRTEAAAATPSATVKVTIGAMMKMPLFDAEGTMVSCRNTLSPSAKLCSSPNGPTTLGPRRRLIAAQTLRSM